MAAKIKHKPPTIPPLYNKAFLSAKDSDEEKLQKAKLWLANTKQQNGEIEV
jgi:hypothetical protein